MESLVSKKRRRCTRTFHCKRCRCKGQHHMLPGEMWLEILTRLPLKSLLISRTVCSSWNIIGTNITNNISYLPQCGLFLGSADYYVCLRTYKATEFPLAKTPDECVVSSGYDKGYLADLSFDFGELFKNAPWKRSLRQGNLRFCTVSRGLLLFGSNDGDLHVQNPATREAFVVPKSPMLKKHGQKKDISLIIRGFETHGYTGFLIIRFCPSRLCVEYYSSKTGSWHRFKSDIESDLRDSVWYMENYIALIINGRIMIFFLTSKDRGIVLKLGMHNSRPPAACSLELPAIAEQDVNRRLGGFGGCLYLSHLGAAGWISVWKHNNCSEVDDDQWVLFHRINITRRFKAVIVDDPVSNLGFNENALILYFITKTNIVSYDAVDDSLDVIYPVIFANPQTVPSRHFAPSAHFTPFLGPLFSPNMKLF